MKKKKNHRMNEIEENKIILKEKPIPIFIISNNNKMHLMINQLQQTIT